MNLFLQQNAFHVEDSCVPLKKQFLMMDLILYLYRRSSELIRMGMPMSLLKAQGVYDRVISVKYDIPNSRPELFEDFKKEIDRFYDTIVEKNA